MVYSEGAKVINAEELKEIIDEDTSNPTIDRLMYIETKTRADMTSRIFPCYLETWANQSRLLDEPEDSEEAPEPELAFQCCIAQYINGRFSFVRVLVYANDLNVNKRIWDKPPTKGLRSSTPWIEKEEKVEEEK